MKNNSVVITLWLIMTGTIFVYSEQTKEASANIVTDKNTKGSDTLIVNARLIEIPGKLPPNDLYNYVYIMKYRIVNVVQGSCAEKEILVGQYNPLIARSMVKDKKMDQYVNGNLNKFTIGEKHTLKLIQPIESVWKDAIEDEYMEDESQRYFAVETNILK
jgi:hypothetical protein